MSYRFLPLLIAVISCLSLAPYPATSNSAQIKDFHTTQQYLDEANKFVIAGKMNDAIQSYSKAIAQDPNHYLALYKRATLYLSLGRHSQTKEDLSRVVVINSDFSIAYLQRGKVFLEEGEFDKSEKDIENYVRRRGEDEQAKELKSRLNSAQQSSLRAQGLFNSQSYEEAITEATEALRYSTSSTSLRLLRARTHLHLSQPDLAIADLTRLTQLSTQPSLFIYVTLLQYFTLYEPESALNHIRSCLRYDPEEKSCKNVYRGLKKLEKRIKNVIVDMQSGAWQAVVDVVDVSGDSILKFMEKLEKQFLEKGKLMLDMPEVKNKLLKQKLFEWICQGYTELKSSTSSLRTCTILHDFQPTSTSHYYLGESHLLSNDYEAAIRHFSTASEMSPNDRRIQQALHRAQKLLQQSKKKDYYKILGVDRQATKREIKKAYRKMAQKYHPDKYKGSEDASTIERRMSDINQAYEVLLNDELRARFDSGNDPNDPSGQYGFPGGHPFGGNPFAQFFQQNGRSQSGFGNGGFQFEFQF